MRNTYIVLVLTVSPDLTSDTPYPHRTQAEKKAAAEKAAAAAALGLLQPLKALSLEADTLRTATAAAVTYCDAQDAASFADLVERASRLIVHPHAVPPYPLVALRALWPAEALTRSVEVVGLGSDGVRCGNSRAKGHLAYTITITQAQAARRAGGHARSDAHPCEEALELSQGDADARPKTPQPKPQPEL